MRRRMSGILAIILAAGMTLTSFPVEAFASENGNVISDEDVNAEDIISDEDVNAEDIISDEDGSIGEDDAAAHEVITDEAPAGSDGYMTGYVAPPDERIPDSVYGGENGIDADGASYLDSRYINTDLSGLRNQNPYGACWAFSSIGLAEHSLRKQGIMTSPDLSELHLAYFTYNTATDPLGGTSGDETTPNVPASSLLNLGGNYQFAGNALAAWTGAADEADAPYVNTSGYTPKLDKSIAFKDKAHIEDIYEINIKTDGNEVKKLILENGAAGIDFRSVSGYNATTTGDLYNEKNNCYYDYIGGQTNHAVMIVGWDDDFSKDKFSKTPEGNGAWLVRNSWTTGNYETGQAYSGYFWMSYYDKGLAESAVVFVFNDADEYDNNYQYDGGLCDSYLYCDRTANIFEVSSEEGTAEELRAVSFKTADVNVDYAISIYTGVSAGRPESGTLAAVVTGRETYAGMHTVELDAPVTLEKGTRFSVVVSLKRGDNDASIAYETPNDITGWANFRASSKAGQSFVDYGTGTWDDFGKSGDGNLRIKAFTCNVKGEQVVPTGLELEDDLGTDGLILNKEDTYQVRYRVLPEEATNKGVDWESEDPSVAIVSNRGLVTAVSEGSTVITATTRLGNISESFTVTVTNSITGIMITAPEDGYLKKNGNYQFEAIIKPEGSADEKDVVWYSSDPDRLSIDKNGKATTGDTVGEVTVTATIGTVTGECTVYIVPDPPTVRASRRDDGIEISWVQTGDVDSYTIYRECMDLDHYYSEPVTTIYDGSANSYTDKAYPTGYPYLKYRVEAHEGGMSACGEACVYFGRTYKITYMTGAGRNPSSNPSVLVEGQIVNLDSPIAPTGYTALAGWYEGHIRQNIYQLPLMYSNDGGMTYSQKYMDYTLTAGYVANKYRVIYMPNGGTGTMSDSTGTYDRQLTLRANAYKKDGYNFTGWNTKPDGSGTHYADKAKVKNLRSGDGDIISLYAQWGGAKFNVSLNAGEGRIISGKKKLAAMTVKVFEEGRYAGLPVPVRSGYDFIGWFTRKEGGTLIENGSLVKKKELTDLTLYARYEPIQSIVSFDGNGEDISVTPLKVEYDAKYSKYGEWPVLADSPKGDFAGWFLEKECLTMVREDTIVKLTDDHTLYAGRYKRSRVFEPDIGIFGKDSSDDYYASDMVEISCDTPGSRIYYTNDGSEPSSENGLLYTGAFPVCPGGLQEEKKVTIKAVGVKEGFTDSYFNTRVFTIYPDEDDPGDLYGDDRTEYEAKGSPAGLWIAGLDPSGYDYEGIGITPGIRVYNGKKRLTEAVDYKLKYSNCVKPYVLASTDEGFNAKKAPAIKVTMMGNYKGSVTEYFKIWPASVDESLQLISLAKAGRIPDQVYTGEPVMPEISLTYGGEVLVEGYDFDAEYRNNTDVGTATVIIRGIDAWTGIRTLSFKITPYVYKASDGFISIEEIEDQVYVKGGVRPEPTVTYGDVELVNGRDYKLTYRNNKAVASDINKKKAPTVKVVLKGNYKGSVERTFSIVESQMEDVTLIANDKVFVNKKGKYTTSFTVYDKDGKKLKAGKDYDKKVSVCYDDDTWLDEAHTLLRKMDDPVREGDIVPVGTVLRIEIKGKGYYSGYVSGLYRIIAADINKASAKKIKTKAFTGRPILLIREEIALSIKRTPLPDAAWYIAGYSANVNKGTATVTLKGMGNYGGTKTIKFKIE